MRPRAVRSKAKRNVVARFPHRPVALVIVRAQRSRARGIARRLCYRVGGITHLQRKQRPYMRLIRLLGNKVVAPHVLLLSEKKRGHLPVVPRLVLYALRGRPISKIVVARKSGCPGQVLLARPQAVISRR